jgi:hypothetical protein
VWVFARRLARELSPGGSTRSRRTTETVTA